MAIIGQARRASEGIIERVAEKIGCEPAVFDAIVRTETGGNGFDVKNRLIIRPEAHKVAKCPHLSVAQKKLAAKLGFTKQPKLVGYHVDPERAGTVAWDWVDRFAREFDEESAFWVTSFGLPQIMGFNHQMCKFSSARSMVQAFADSEDAQLEAMGEFILSAGLKDACRQRKWKVIARAYNGVNYEKNDYDTKLSNAYADSSYAKDSKFVWPEDDVLEMGEKGNEIRVLQARLTELGFHVRADGDFGAETRDAVRAFQFRVGLGVDGKVGPLTRQALAAAAPKEPPKTPMLEVVSSSGTAKAAVAQIVTGVTTAAVAAGSVATAPDPASAPLPSLSDIDAALKTSEHGLTIANKILGIGLDRMLIALAIGAAIFGGIALWRRLDAHYTRKIG